MAYHHDQVFIDQMNHQWVFNLIMFVSAICMVYSLIICVETISFDLSSAEWIITPSKRVKRSAVFVSSLMAIAFVIRLSHPILVAAIGIDEENPIVRKVMAIMCNLIYVVNMTTIYFHLLSRLRHSFNNEMFHTQTPSKKLYNALMVLLFIYLAVPLLHIIFDIAHPHEYSYPRTCGQVCILWIAVEFTINAVLAYSYGYAMYKYVKYCYCFEYVTKRDRTCLDEAQIKKLNTVMVELRRYTVIAFVICGLNMSLSMMFIALKITNTLQGGLDSWIIETIVVTSILMKQLVA